MTPRFNLIDEPWIPLRTPDGRVQEAGLKEALCRAHEFAALAEPSPPNLVALHRLLLALLSRCLADEEWDPAAWWKEGLPRTAIEAYLERWRDRFWVFHDTHPFMQAAVLSTAPETRDKVKPWTQLTMSRSGENSPLLFDHIPVDSPPTSSPAVVMRSLLGYLQFVPGMPVKSLVKNGNDSGGPLVNTAAVIPQGGTLARTLLLGLHSSEDGDIPTWEKDSPTVAQFRADGTLPTGRNDLYTRLARSALLLSEDDTGREVRLIRFAEGVALDWKSSIPEPMAAYIKRKDMRLRLGFQEGRAIWRDLPSILPHQDKDQNLAPRILDDAYSMLEEGEESTDYLSILVAGLASDQANLIRWNAVSFLLPRTLLEGTTKATTHLRGLFAEAEQTGIKLEKLGKELLWIVTRLNKTTKKHRSKIEFMFSSLPIFPIYYAHLETQVPAILALLAQDDEDAFRRAHTAWTKTQIEAAKRAWTATRAALGDSLPVIRAVAKVGPGFGRLIYTLKKELPETEQTKEEAA